MGDKQGGQCLCGAVAFRISVPEPVYSICHCGNCRRWSGGPLMSVHCPGDVEFDEPGAVAWYRSSEWAERGFCRTCGSSLFWRLAEDPGAMLIVSVDAFNDASEFKLSRHIFSDSAPERYAFADNCPRVTEAEVFAEFGAGDAGE